MKQHSSSSHCTYSRDKGQIHIAGFRFPVLEEARKHLGVSSEVLEGPRNVIPWRPPPAPGPQRHRKGKQNGGTRALLQLQKATENVTIMCQHLPERCCSSCPKDSLAWATHAGPVSPAPQVHCRKHDPSRDQAGRTRCEADLRA